MMSPRHWWLAVAVACAASLSACDSSSEDTPPGGDDTSDTGDTTPDVPEVEAPPNSVELGGLCNSDVSCMSAFCVKIGQGFNEGICTKRCESGADCDVESWDCVGVNSGSGDEVSACIPDNLCIDKDGDGYGVGPGCLGGDCDDNAPSVNPGAPELCNGVDDNCDGLVDNNLVDTNQPCDTGQLGECSDGMTLCSSGTLSCQPNKQPSQEVCDGLDNDCDGMTDEPQRADENDNFVLGIGVTCNAPGSGSCNVGERVCDPELGGVICVRNNDPNDRLCNGIDDNCDGTIDSGVAGLGDLCYSGEGVCRTLGVNSCDPLDGLAPVVCDAKSRDELATTEVCDFEDNNCDGQIDEDFTDESGKYSLVAYCGGCNTNCTNFWQPSPAALHVTPTCSPAGATYLCGYSCEAGWFDADGDDANGCELKPDAQAIYVSTPQKGGADTNTCGAWNFPCATIAKGLDRAASATAKRVLVAEGIYREGVILREGIDVLGGHNAINWTRAIAENTTVIFGAAAGFDPHSIGVVAQNITKATVFSGFTISTPDGQQGGNSIAMFVRNSTSALTVQNNVMLAGFGGQGTSGTAGTNGNNGAAGGTGGGGGSTCSSAPAGGQAGATQCGGGVTTLGGSGAGGTCSGYGSPGLSPAPGVTVASGGAGGAAGKTAYTRGGYIPTIGGGKSCLPKPSELSNSFSFDGGGGQGGANGAGGAGATSSNGAVGTDGLWQGAKGGAGQAGRPGGGGGGGGANHGIKVCTTRSDTGMSGCTGSNYLGAGGGGGGAGGCAGANADGGSAGGGSFGLLLSYASTPASVPVIKDNAISRNSGGQGGDGGIGGSGGFGGNGGVGGAAPYGSDNWDYCGQNGRRGGDGGRGGHGGGGGGGAGGNSFDIVVAGAAASVATTLKSNNQLLVPEATNLAGPGGPGGGSMGTPGTSGAGGSFGAVKTF